MTTNGAESPYQMLYCDNPACRVNTFERGERTEYRNTTGRCPGCYKVGKPVDP